MPVNGPRLTLAQNNALAKNQWIVISKADFLHRTRSFCLHLQEGTIPQNLLSQRRTSHGINTLPTKMSETHHLKLSMDAQTKMQIGNLDAASSDHHGKISKQTVSLDGVSVTRVTFGVGAKWSQDLKDYAGTDTCQLPHVALVLSGTLHVEMEDGDKKDFSKNDVMLLPPGHDAWSVGDEACVFVEFSKGGDFYEMKE